jgi:hypothetical protein
LARLAFGLWGHYLTSIRARDELERNLEARWRARAARAAGGVEAGFGALTR